MTYIQKISVCLWNINSPMLIVPAKTGVFYENQTFGVNCIQDCMEGYLIPIDSDYLPCDYQKSFDAQLRRFFPESNPGYIEEHLAQKLERLFWDIPETRGLEINWQKLIESHEAWLHVILQDAVAAPYKGLRNTEAVLTWCNSD